MTDNVSISDEQMDEFFEKRGEVELGDNHTTVENAEVANDPVEEKKEEVSTPEKQEAAKPEEQPKLVPLKALQEAREERRQYQEQLNELRKKNEKMELTFQQFQARLMQKEQEDAPKFEDDPTEALRYRQEKIEEKISEQERTLSEQKRIQEHQKELTNLVERYNQKAQEYIKDNPDFWDAYNHLRQIQYNVFVNSGYNERAAAELLQNYEIDIARRSEMEGANPAERIYSAAKALGYSKQVAATAKTEPENKPDEKTIEEQAKKLESIEDGIKKNKSLGNAGGETPKANLTLEELAELNGDEFDAHWKQIEKIMRRKSA